MTKITKEEIMAELDQTRKCGYSLIDREVSLNYAGIACPIYNTNDDIEASIGITGDHKRITGKEKKELVEILQQAAEDISVSLGHARTSRATISNHFTRRKS
jgi:DNA-binding IclR family transcriptional regulator